MPTWAIIGYIFAAICFMMAIFFTIHPVYTEEELKAMREEKKMKKKLKQLTKHSRNDIISIFDEPYW